MTLIILGEEYNLLNFSLRRFLQLLIFPSLALITLFSNTLRLCSSLNIRGQVSHPYKTTGKIISLPEQQFYNIPSVLG
jgi:hypothetical protein